MRPEIRIDAEAFKKRLAQMGPEKRKAVEKVVTVTALNIHRRAVTSIQRGPATGRVYEKYQPRRTHQASAPGQPPQSDTGRLASSIRYVLNGLSAAVGTSVEYGRHLEFGTTEVLPRPWLVPAVEAERPAFRKALEAALK